MPALYHGWGTLDVRPKSDRFEQVLQRVRGLTSANVLQLLNWAVGCLEDPEIYAEIGCFQGATLVGALLDHRQRCACAVDNFSIFDPHGENYAVLVRNLTDYGIQERTQFINKNFEQCLLELSQEPRTFGVYFYDGAHDYRSQLLGLLLARPFFANRALIVVDDANCPGAKQATWDFMAACPEARLLFDLPTPANCHPSFWNGLYVLAWEKDRSNERDWSQFERTRQNALLESLDLLQLVDLKKTGNSLSVIPRQE